MARPALAAIVILALAAPVAAQEPSADQRDALAARVAELEAAMRDGGPADAAFGFMPERLKALLAADESMSVTELEATMRAAFDDAFPAGAVEVDLDLDAATFGTAPGAGPQGDRAYALIPTTMTLLKPDGDAIARLPIFYVAFEDEGRWQLWLVNNVEARSTLEAAYPEFDGELPPTPFGAPE